MLTDEQLEQLDAIHYNHLAKHKEDGSVVFELRGKGGQDAFPPSLYLAEKKEADDDDE